MKLEERPDPKVLVEIYRELHNRVETRSQINPESEDQIALDELTERIWQLGWLLRQIVDRVPALESYQRLVLQHVKAETDPDQHTLAAISDSMREVNLLTEAFYMFAWRARELTQNRLRKLRISPKGTDGVRNHLIAHPEKKRGKLMTSYSFGPYGPQLKPGAIGRDDNPFHDRGLWPNAQEFAALLFRRLEDRG